MCFKGENLSGSKKSKEQFTVLLVANMDGSDKLRLFVIVKSTNPCCFRGIKKLPVTYKSNKNSWMAATLFQECLEWFDVRLQKHSKKFVCGWTIFLPTKLKIMDYSALNLYFCHRIQLCLFNCLTKASLRTSNTTTVVECYKKLF